MPGKSRHGKGKHYSKKSRAMMRQGTAPAVSSASAAAQESTRAAAPVVSAPAPRASVVTAKAIGNPYPFIASELRRIGLLAGIIIVILVVLSIVLT